MVSSSAEPFRWRARVSGRASADGAFADVVDRHARDLARFAYMICGDRSQAEEVVAEAFARTWPQWRRGRVDALLPYLRRSIVHEIHGRGRRRKLEKREQELRRAPAARADGRFETGISDRYALWPLVARLPVQQRAVIVLRIVEDLSEEQAAAMLGVPAGTVKSRLSRALTNLRSMVEEGS